MTPVAYWRHARTRLRSGTTAACVWAQGWPRRQRGRRAEQRQLAHGCKASQGGNEAERRAEGRVLCCTTKWTLRQEGRLSGCHGGSLKPVPEAPTSNKSVDGGENLGLWPPQAAPEWEQVG